MRLLHPARQGRFKAGPNLADWEADQRRFVHIVDNLTVQSGPVNPDTAEVILLVDQGLNDPRHEILHQFKAEEVRKIMRMLEAGSPRDEEPKHLHHLQRQTSNGMNRDLTATMPSQAPQRAYIRLRQGALWHKYQD